MKKLILIKLFCIGTLFISSKSFGQANPFINVLPSNSGVVSVGSTIDIEVTIGNTGPISDVPQAKLRPLIDVPPSVTFLPNAQQTGLPAGWTILSNTGSQLRVCNSTDPIAATTSRTIILKVQGVTITPPQPFSGNINFGNGVNCGNGPSVLGDITTDNSSSSTIQVIGIPLPLVLNNFSVKSDNCIAHLSWNTSSETKFEKFEIEKSESNSAKWETVGNVMAKGNSSAMNTAYYFNDDKNIISNKVVLYRLKMIDIDGSFSYSPVVNALLKCDEQNLSVYPNPVTSGKFNVSLNSSVSLEANLTTVTGQLVKKFNLENGINIIDVSELSNGVYILNTRLSNGINQNIKVNIQK